MKLMPHFLVFQVTVILGSLFLVSSNDLTPNQWLYSSTDPDFGKTPCQLIESRQFVCEQHFVTTEDGYILGVHRIVNPILKKKGIPLKKPYILQHGLFGASVHFIINSDGGFADDWTNGTHGIDLNQEGRNLGYLLANYGYDIWMTNNRGNVHSKNHTKLNPKKDPQFWRFSFDEFIAYDTPNLIDYVLKVTGSETVGWIGHSQGTLVMFGLLSEKPEYAEKVKPFIAMAPIAHVTYITSPIRYLIDVPGLMNFFFLAGGELTFPQVLVDLMAKDVCGHSVLEEVCGSSLFIVCGYDAAQLNFTRVPVYLNQASGGTSAWNLLHFGQNIVNKGFLKFDYGLIGNVQKYNSFTPPAYDLGAIQSEDMYLFCADTDVFTDGKDLDTLRQSLRVPFTEYRMSNPQFSHLDFIWAKDAYEQVYSTMLRVMERY